MSINAGKGFADLSVLSDPMLDKIGINTVSAGKPVTVASGGAADGGRNPGCQSHSAQRRVQPFPSPGISVLGSGKVDVSWRSGGERTGVRTVVNSPQRICIELVGRRQSLMALKPVREGDTFVQKNAWGPAFLAGAV